MRITTKMQAKKPNVPNVYVLPFLVKLIDGRCFCACCVNAAIALFAALPCPTRARGLRGDSTLPRANGDVGPDCTGVAFAAAALTVISPVTLRRIRGLPPGRPMRSVGSLGRSTSEKKGESDSDVSAPMACRLAFSCFDCTARKCCNSSCHLISSRPILDRVFKPPPTVLLRRS